MLKILDCVFCIMGVNPYIKTCKIGLNKFVLDWKFNCFGLFSAMGQTCEQLQ